MKRVLLVYLFLCFSLLGFSRDVDLRDTDPPKTSSSIQNQTTDQKVDSLKLNGDSAHFETPAPPINFEGTVEVSFKIEADGTINIININATNPELIQYVIAKLGKIKLDPVYKDLGKTIKYRFKFNKEA